MLLDNTRFAYATGRIRVIERLLIDRSGYNRMIDAATVKEAAEVLSEAGYAVAGGTDIFAGKDPRRLGDSFGAHEIENLLEAERRKTGELLMEVSPDEYIANYFLIKNDYHNIKVILKAEFSGAGTYDPAWLSVPGVYEAGKLAGIITGRLYGDMPEIMRKAVSQALDIFGRTGDPQLSDIVLDSARFAQMKEYAAASGDTFLSGLAVVMIDMSNIKSALRCIKLGKAADFAERVLIRGGSMDISFFNALRDAEPQIIAEQLEGTRYGGIISGGIRSYLDEGKLISLEKAADSCIIQYADKAKYVAIGPEPVIRYFVVKEYEIMNAGIILAGKTGGIPGNVIRERIRDAHV